VLINARAATWESGEDWFLRQDGNTQARILGVGRYDAWRAGEFELSAVVTKRSDATWGDSYTPTPLRQLVQQ
jgi:hypothetical protein